MVHAAYGGANFNTPEGGRAYTLFNASGGVIYPGELVELTSAAARSFIRSRRGTANPCGVSYETVNNGEECWVVTDGLANVWLDASGSCTAGQVLCASPTEDGRVRAGLLGVPVAWSLAPAGAGEQVLAAVKMSPVEAVWDTVTAYGARGDGVTDDTAAIQAAIDGAGSGSTLLFPPGTYKVGNLRVDGVNGLTLAGFGPNSKLQVTTGCVGIIVAGISSVSWLRIASMSIDGLPGALGGVLLGSGAAYTAYTCLSDVHIQNFTGLNAYGLGIATAQELRVEGCWIFNNYNGIHKKVVAGGYITSTTIGGMNGYIGHNTNCGVLMDGIVDSVCLHDIVFEGNTKQAIWANTGGSGPAKFIVDKCYFELNNANGSGSGVIRVTGTAGAYMGSELTLTKCTFHEDPLSVPYLKTTNCDGYVYGNMNLLAGLDGTEFDATCKFFFRDNKDPTSAAQPEVVYIGATGIIGGSDMDASSGRWGEFGHRQFMGNGNTIRFCNVHLAGRQDVAPAVAVTANAGTGASASIAAGSSDIRGRLTLTTGSGAWGAGRQVDVTLTYPFETATPHLFVTPGNAAAALAMATRGVYVEASGAQVVHVCFAVADTAQVTYVWNYWVIE